MADQQVDDYIANLSGWQREVAQRLQTIVTDAAPGAREVFKWSQPVYEVNGPVCYFKAFKNSLNFGFWRGVDLEDPYGLLEGAGDKMRHVKLSGAEDVHAEAFTDYVRQAVRLNLLKGDPTKGS